MKPAPPIPEQIPVAPSAELKPSVVSEQPIKPQNKAPDVIIYNNKENMSDYPNTAVTSNDVKNFLRKRLPFYNSTHTLEETQSQDDDSGKQTSSSKSLSFVIPPPF